MEDKGTKLSLHSIRSLFDDTWKMYQERFSTLTEIVLLPVLVMTLGYVLLSLGRPFSVAGGLVLFAGWIIFALSSFALIFSVRNTAGVDASYKATTQLFWPIVWLLILQTLAAIGAFFMLIVPGIWLSFAISLASYVFVIEHRRGIDALRQSKDYVKGYWWAFLGRALLLGFIFLLITAVVEGPVGATLGATAKSIASILLDLFLVPFSVIYNYNIYENLRERKPDMAMEQTKKGTGFITTSAIVGIVVPIILIILAVCLFPQHL